MSSPNTPTVIRMAAYLGSASKVWQVGAGSRIAMAVRVALERNSGKVILDFEEAQGPGLMDLFLGIVDLQATLAPKDFARCLIEGMTETNLELLNRTLLAARWLRGVPAA